jgi:hypothetical protein
METQIINQMAAALGEEVISLLADRSTLAIERRPRTDTVWVFRRGEKWKDTTLKISNEAIDRFIAAVGEYHGIPISDANPRATVRLPKEVFQKAEATIMVPPVTPDGPSVVINTARGVAELEEQEREFQRRFLRERPFSVKQQVNGRVGELRTEAMLARHFWILSRSVDVDGADFIIELPSETQEILRDRRKQLACHGIVQAKYCEGTNAVRVAKEYVLEDDGETRKDFFLFIHSDEEQGDDELPIYYFFTATEIVEHLPLKEDATGAFYEFCLARNRRYEQFKGIRRKVIVERITRLLREAWELYLRVFTERLPFHTIEAGRFQPETPFTYLFRKFEGTNVVLVRDDQTGQTSLLEPRRDLYECFGGFIWGYRGTGPHFLATSLLAHHLNGQRPSREQVNRLLDYLEMFPGDEEFDLSSSLLETVISG